MTQHRPSAPGQPNRAEPSSTIDQSRRNNEDIHEHSPRTSPRSRSLNAGTSLVTPSRFDLQLSSHDRASPTQPTRAVPTSSTLLKGISTGPTQTPQRRTTTWRIPGIHRLRQLLPLRRPQCRSSLCSGCLPPPEPFA